MCGIAGIFDLAAETSEAQLDEICVAMIERLHHRGPDDRGTFVDASSGVGLASRRLAIVDLSPLGHQPMVSADSRWSVVYNGELYNHRELRRELEAGGYCFRGRSDTEVLLAAISSWGLDRALTRSNGMFAFAVWDAREQALHVCRDRIGEKPLYYALVANRFVFASELKALRGYSGFVPSIDASAVATYLRLSYIPAPDTIYEGVRKLRPGSVLTVRRSTSSFPEPRAFWSLTDTISSARRHPFDGSGVDACDALDELLGDAIKLRTQSDAPLGAFLSGGIDSTTVVAMMTAQMTEPVRTFTIAMPSAGYDESIEAATVAKYLGTDHTCVELTPDDAFDLVPRLPEVYDEPFADPSQLPTMLLSQVTRRDVTVALSGDGGDEVFAGYNRYVLGRRILSPLDHLPRVVRAGVGRLVLRVPPHWWDESAALLPKRIGFRTAGDKARKLGELLTARGAEERYRALVSQWPREAIVDGVERASILSEPWRWPSDLSETEVMNFLDTAVGLPDDMLVKVDRASMSASLEVRTPFLDHRVLEFAWSLPLDMRIRNRQGKWLVRRMLDRYIPRALIDRPKMGFDPPLGEWLRGPLRDWAETLISPERLRAHGHIDPSAVRRVWEDHLARRRNWDYRLWAVLMLESWLGASGD